MAQITIVVTERGIRRLTTKVHSIADAKSVAELTSRTAAAVRLLHQSAQQPEAELRTWRPELVAEISQLLAIKDTKDPAARPNAGHVQRARTLAAHAAWDELLHTNYTALKLLIVGQNGERPEVSIHPSLLADYAKAVSLFLVQAHEIQLVREVQP
jgi:hypothetical protein